jgi:hypothetical protein
MRNENAKVYALTENDTVVGGPVFMVFALNCSPCSLSLTHQPPATSHSPAVTEDSDPMTAVSSRWTLCLQAQGTEAALFVVKGDALDQNGDFLGRGLAFRECGGHRWEFILPRESAGGGVRKAIQGRFG